MFYHILGAVNDEHLFWSCFLYWFCVLTQERGVVWEGCGSHCYFFSLHPIYANPPPSSFLSSLSISSLRMCIFIWENSSLSWSSPFSIYIQLSCPHPPPFLYKSLTHASSSVPIWILLCFYIYPYLHTPSLLFISSPRIICILRHLPPFFPLWSIPRI